MERCPQCTALLKTDAPLPKTCDTASIYVCEDCNQTIYTKSFAQNLKFDGGSG